MSLFIKIQHVSDLGNYLLFTEMESVCVYAQIVPEIEIINFSTKTTKQIKIQTELLQE